jgi:Cu/Ag efflux pump CusA
MKHNSHDAGRRVSRNSRRRASRFKTICLGLTAEESDRLVNVPMEQALNGLPGLSLMRSKAGPATCPRSSCSSKPGTDLIRARQLVQERLATVLPNLADLGGVRRS